MKYEEILKWRQDVYDATIGQYDQQQMPAMAAPSRRANATWAISQVNAHVDNSPVQAFDWQLPRLASKPMRLPGQLTDSSPAPAPEPVPASLAPAQGQLPPKILKRPISGSFSAQVVGSAPVPTSNIINEAERAAAAGSTMETGSSTSHARDETSPPQNYALGLAGAAQPGDNQDNDQGLDAGFAEPRQGYEFPPLQRLRVTNRV